MPFVPVKLYLDNKTYAEFLAGKAALYGMAKDPKLKRVKKHLPAVVDEGKDTVAKAVAVVKEHRQAVLGAGIGLAVLGAIVWFFTFFTQRKKKKTEKAFMRALHTYLEAAQECNLTSEVIDSLIAALDAIAKCSKGKSAPLKIPAKQLSSLLNSIFDYTQRLATANNMSLSKLKAPKNTKNIVVDLRQYLKAQREIIEKSA